MGISTRADILNREREEVNSIVGFDDFEEGKSYKKYALCECFSTRVKRYIFERFGKKGTCVLLYLGTEKFEFSKDQPVLVDTVFFKVPENLVLSYYEGDGGYIVYSNKGLWIVIWQRKLCRSFPHAKEHIPREGAF